MRPEMVAIASPSMTYTVIQRIPNHTAPTGIGAVDPYLQIALLDVGIEVEIGNARFDYCEMTPVIDLDHAVHALEVDDDAAGQVGSRAAITQILARRDRKQ